MNGFMEACLEMLGTKTADDSQPTAYLGTVLGGLAGGAGGYFGGGLAARPIQEAANANYDKAVKRIRGKADALVAKYNAPLEQQRTALLQPYWNERERLDNRPLRAAGHASLQEQAFGSPQAKLPPSMANPRKDLAQDIREFYRANPAARPQANTEARARYERGYGWSPQPAAPARQPLPQDLATALEGAQADKRTFNDAARRPVREFQAMLDMTAREGKPGYQSNPLVRSNVLHAAFEPEHAQAAQLRNQQYERQIRLLYRAHDRIVPRIDRLHRFKDMVGRAGRGAGGLLGGLGGALAGNVLQHWLQGQKQGMDKEAANPNMLRQAMNATGKFLGGFGRQAAPHAYKPNPVARAAVGGIAGNFAGDALGDPTGFNVGGSTDPRTGKTVGGMRINPLGIAAGATLGGNATSGRRLATTFNTGMGAMMGNETGNAMVGEQVPGMSFRVGGQVNPETGKYEGGMRINPLGIAGGVMMGNRHLAGTSLGRSLERPLMGAWRGAMTGAATDYAARQAAGVDTGGWGATAGGWGGLAAGLGSNRFLNQRDAIIGSARNATNLARQNFGAEGALSNIAADTKAKLDALKGGWSGTAHRLTNAGEQAYHGEWDPIQGGLRRAGNWFMGAKDVAPAMPKDPMAFAGRRFGQALGTVGLGTGLGGMAYHAATSGIKKQVQDAYAGLRQNAEADTDAYLRSRGFLNQNGQFDPTQGIRQSVGQHFVDPFLQMLGHDPSQMSLGQKMTHMAGPALAAGGAYMGNPWMTTAGIGAMAYPHLQGQPGQPHLLAQALATLRQGPQPNTPQARNELEAQRARQMSHADGQGYL